MDSGHLTISCDTYFIAVTIKQNVCCSLEIYSREHSLVNHD